MTKKKTLALRRSNRRSATRLGDGETLARLLVFRQTSKPHHTGVRQFHPQFRHLALLERDGKT